MATNALSQISNECPITKDSGSHPKTINLLSSSKMERLLAFVHNRYFDDFNKWIKFIK